MGRAIDTKPTGDIGQTAAASQIVKSGAGFEGLNLDGLFLSGANLTDANFRKVHAAGALLTRSSLGKANFTDATMPFINLTDASAEGANLEYTYLPYADADRVVLQNAELSRANWFGASLKGADLGGASSGASLALADLRDADLRKADLTNAVLFGAVMNGAKLDEAIFQNTDIGSAVGIGPQLGLKPPSICARKISGGGVTYFSTAGHGSDSERALRFRIRIRPHDDGRPAGPDGFANDDRVVHARSDKDMPRGSPVFQNEIYDDSISFQLSSQLSTGGRRSQFLERIRRPGEVLKKNVQPEGFLRTGSSRMAATMSEFDKAMAGLQRPATDCLDADTFDLLAESGRGTITTQQTWAALAALRLSHESQTRREWKQKSIDPESATARTLEPWGMFFSANFNQRDLTPEVLARVRKMGTKASRAAGAALLSMLRRPGSHQPHEHRGRLVTARTGPSKANLRRPASNPTRPS